MFKFNNDTPIYLQIVDLIRNNISSGKLKPGQKLPSVREYALEFKVNPNTICKAMQILEDKKIIYTERTNGKYVTNDQKLIDKYKSEYALSLSKKYYEDMEKLGYKRNETINYLKELGGE